MQRNYGAPRRAWRRLLAGLGVAAATILATGPAAMAATRAPVAAPTAADPGGSIGGAALASKGLVVDPLPGAPPLPKGLGPSGALSPSGWLVADLDTGDVLAAKDPHGQFMPASTLKILTAVTLLPRLDPKRTVMVTNADAAVDGTKVGVVPGTRYSVHDLFNAMLMMSANDAALALADAGGGLPATLAAMNDTARYLQADDTVAKTPNGLDAPGQVTSAYDLALIARAGLAMPDFRRYIATTSVAFPAPHHKHYMIYTHDKLLLNYKGAIGVKNGYTVAARASFVGAATRDGHTLIVTMLHADPACWKEAAKLLDWGFAARTLVRPVGTLVGPVQPAAAASSAVPSAAPQRAHAVTVAVSHPQHSSADVAAPVGAVAGTAIAGLAVARTRVRRRRGRRRGRMALPRT